MDGVGVITVLFGVFYIYWCTLISPPRSHMLCFVCIHPPPPLWLLIDALLMMVILADNVCASGRVDKILLSLPGDDPNAQIVPMRCS